MLSPYFDLSIFKHFLFLAFLLSIISKFDAFKGLLSLMSLKYEQLGPNYNKIRRRDEYLKKGVDE